MSTKMLNVLAAGAVLLITGCSEQDRTEATSNLGNEPSVETDPTSETFIDSDLPNDTGASSAEMTKPETPPTKPPTKPVPVPPDVKIQPSPWQPPAEVDPPGPAPDDRVPGQ